MLTTNCWECGSPKVSPISACLVSYFVWTTFSQILIRKTTINQRYDLPLGHRGHFGAIQDNKDIFLHVTRLSKSASSCFKALEFPRVFPIVTQTSAHTGSSQFFVLSQKMRSKWKRFKHKIHGVCFSVNNTFLFLCFKSLAMSQANNLGEILGPSVIVLELHVPNLNRPS